ncbi:hypothetical protein PFICI_07217 [Pestalotiopsis fici W106-1]|uniref:DUF6536 domain-containing protein n=1 Tax=Pestalotiopsis fici (strain W106-1 / CGMCC3.15140) TaxID=1229662 RepID=W3X850_PESFW|nr:uncharacterized protein PFICI_07217 [Pestalotiopsis fici W106-1]ETS82215.1 hypothetical protein PFICI_07217 [Pestalotiopsis fici W106-1]
MLLLSSIPLHLLFNSLIFQTDQRDSEYQLAIASEGFFTGVPFYVPGASLNPPGWMTTSSGFYGGGGYGLGVILPSNNSSVYHRNVSAMASEALIWDNLTAQECYNDYFSCGGIKGHRNVIAVVDQKDGWIRDEVWNLMANQSEFWDPIVPSNETNSLWWAGPCAMMAEYVKEDGVVCRDTCTSSWGHDGYMDSPTSKKTNNSPWVLSFFNDSRVMWLVNNTKGPDGTYLHQASPNEYTNDITPGASDLTVNYCLAEPIDHFCYVSISNVLLLAVTICVLVKTMMAIIVTVVLARRDQAPLVTMGDAVVSFIERPDRTTVGICTIGQRDIRGHSNQYQATQLAGPRAWAARVSRRYKVVPVSVWFTSYALFALGVGVISYFLNMAMTFLDHHLTGQVLESDTNPFLDSESWSFASAVLVANSPQLLLSFCYLAYNNLFTRLQMAKEWATYSQGYYPLRVTDPKGEQFSTYRLQLPYKYSIPLIACSILLHWLLSNTIYVFVSAGGYFDNDLFTYQRGYDSSLPDGTIVSVGYSTWSLIVMLAVSVTLVTIPIALSFKKLPSGSLIVGSNSMAISAACHVSSVSNVATRGALYSNESIKSNRRSWKWLPSRLEAPPPPYSPLNDAQKARRDSLQYVQGDDQSLLTPHGRPESDHFEMRDLSRHTSRASLLSGRESPMTKEDVYEQIARSKVRWGVVTMPPEFYAEYEQEQSYGHLSFGVEEDEVTPPVDKVKYA